MLRSDLAPAFEAMIKADLTFAALVLPKHLSRLRELLSRYPNLRTVSDHAAKPAIASGQFDHWARDIATIARESRVYCKLSGLLTEAGQDWTSADVAPYVAHLLDHFGPERLVWGSDWPVLNLAADYGTWVDMAKSFIQNEPDQLAIFGKNAVDLYRLAPD
jgi:L-fuconolactonase